MIMVNLNFSICKTEKLISFFFLFIFRETSFLRVLRRYYEKLKHVKTNHVSYINEYILISSITEKYLVLVC